MRQNMYACLYGLRDRCEALEMALEMALGRPPIPEPKTDEEKMVQQIFLAIQKYTPILPTMEKPNIFHQVRSACEICPHRLAKIKEYALEGTVYPAPR